jgi:RNA polymerase sigma factor (sigma-70 family)
MTAETQPMNLSLASSSMPEVQGESDESLVRRLRGGETAAGEMLVKRYHQSLMRYLQRLTRSDHVAEELHQQTWLSVLDHLDRFDAGASSGGFKAWLFRIATNKANDLWRSRGREKTAKEGLKLVTEEEAPEASFRMEGSEQELKLRRAIEQLPENQRQVLLLRYYSGLKFIEIAEMLGCPLNTALGRMHKAMQKLKTMMEES